MAWKKQVCVWAWMTLSLGGCAGCDRDTLEEETQESTRRDAGGFTLFDGGSGADAAGTGDAGQRPDAGSPDAAAAPDAATPPDASVPDAAAVDAGTTDAGTTDAATPDAGMTDAGSPDAACAACDSWAPAAPLPAPRQRHTATLLKDGRVLVVGGDDDTNAVLGTALVYDPANNTWTPTGSLAHPRFSHTATLLNDDRVLVVGGNGGFDGMGAIYLGSAELYSPTTGTWTEVTPAPVNRSGHTAAKLSNGRVVIAGGTNATAYVQATEVFDPATNRFTSGGNLSQVRYVHAAATLSTGAVAILGGRHISTNLDSTEVFSGSSWSNGPALPSARWGLSVTPLQDGSLLMAGGTAAGGAIATAATLNGANLAPTTTAPLGTARWAHEAVRLASGEVLIIAGTNSTTLASCELYSPAMRTFRPAASMVNARIEHAAVRLDDGRVLVVGGSLDALPTTSVEIYTPPAP